VARDKTDRPLGEEATRKEAEREVREGEEGEMKGLSPNDNIPHRPASGHAVVCVTVCAAPVPTTVNVVPGSEGTTEEPCNRGAAAGRPHL
jgi:hypothetical protein